VSEIGKFTQPDQVDGGRYFIEFLETVERLPAVHEVREKIRQHLQAGPGSHVLDVGCGVGFAALDLAGRVGPGGSVCGMDISEAMVAEARRRADGLTNIQFRTGNACDLPYENNRFDAVRMERVLLYVADRPRAIAEMIRVAKLGARVVVTDVELETTAIYSRDRLLTRKLMAILADSIPNPASARELPALLQDAGLRDVTYSPVAHTTPYEFCLMTTRGALYAAVEAGKVSREEVDTWYRDLAEIHQAGRFFQLWYNVVVSGTVVK